jgi:protease-4
MKVHSKGDMNISVQTPVSAKVDAVMNTLTDPGPLQEVAIQPSCSHPGGPKIALIDVDGLLLNLNRTGSYSLGENAVAAFQEKLNAAGHDPAVKAVVLRINSPGGSVAAAEMMARAAADFRQQTGKPLVGCLLDMGAGGAYYLASCCDHLFAIPGSVVGGIGVMLNLYYLEIAMEQWNTFGNPIKSGDRIDMGTPTRKMTAEEKAMLTAMAKEYHDNFKQTVLHNRPHVRADSGVFDGRVLSASKAVELGLLDGVAYLPEVIDRVRQGIGSDAVSLVMYSRASTPARTLYDIAPNRPMQPNVVNWSVPGMDRSRLPLFLYLWEVEPTLVRIAAD